MPAVLTSCLTPPPGTRSNRVILTHGESDFSTAPDVHDSSGGVRRYGAQKRRRRGFTILVAMLSGSSGREAIRSGGMADRLPRNLARDQSLPDGGLRDQLRAAGACAFT